MSSSKNKIVLISALFGDLDDLKVVPNQTIPIDKICFTNSNVMKGNNEFNGWKLIYPVYPRYDLNNRIKAKYFRTMSHTIKELKSYYIIIWLDASLQILREDFIEFMIRNINYHSISFFKHHTRNCIYEEAKASDAPKYHGEPIAEQINEYRLNGYPENNGLIETGCFARLINRETNKIMEKWFLENIRYSYQDQLSLPYILWKEKFTPYIIEKNIQNNEYCYKASRLIEKEIL